MEKVAQYAYDHIVWIDRKTKESVKRIHCDSAKVLMAIGKTLQRIAIYFTKTSAHTAESSRVAKRMNETLIDKARAMMEKAGLTYQYWAEVVRHATCLYNGTFWHVLQIKKTFELFLGKIPQRNKLHVIDSQIYDHILKESSKIKLHVHDESGMYPGVDDGLYRVMLGRPRQEVTTKYLSVDEGLIQHVQEQRAKCFLEKAWVTLLRRNKKQCQKYGC